MTITAQTAKSGPYTGNGSTTVFAYAFKALLEADLVVTLTVTATGVETTQTLTTHYTVSGVGDAGGGNVTMVTAPASGETLTVSRDVALTQGTDLVNRGAVQPVVLETMSDRLTQQNQDQQEKLARAMLLPVSTETTVDATLPAPAANTTVAWNDDADALVEGPTVAEVSGANASAVAAAASAAAAAADAVSTDADATATAADAISTAADAATTAQDAIDTAADLVQTNLDQIATAADAVSTAADAVSTAADAATTAQDAIDTAADAVATAADLVLTDADQISAAASAAATAADVISTNADVVSTNADVVLTHADVVSTNADVVTTNADAATTTQDAIDTAADVVSTNADVVTTTQDAIDTAADAVSTAADLVLTDADQISAAASAAAAAASAASVPNMGAYAGVLETNATFVDQAIFGPSVDGKSWNGKWGVASLYSSLMLVTIEDAGADTQVNIWDLTEVSSSAPSTTPLGTVTLSGAATPTSVAACMGYIIVGSEDGISIIDPHSGSWAERTAGWPRSLSTSTAPALTDNDIDGVCAGFAQQPAHDPRTGGPMPTFGAYYGTSADVSCLIKDNGTVIDFAGSNVTGAGVAIMDGQFYHIDNSNGRLAKILAPIDAITADDSAGASVMNGETGYPEAFDLTNISASGGRVVGGGGNGFTGIISNASATEATARGIPSFKINRTYNTGYMVGDIRGAWLANSATADRSYKANTLTANGSITAAAVASGAELQGYSGWSDSVYMSRASDADWDVLGTGDVYMSCWIKNSSSTNSAVIGGFANSGGTVRFQLRWGSNGTMGPVFDGASANASFGDTGPVIDDGEWHKVEMIRRATGTSNEQYTDGILVGSSTTDIGSLSDSGNLPLRIGDGPVGSDVADSGSTTALFRLSATAPSATQIRQMYDAEKGMFVASAECLLQSGSTDAVLDVDVDPLTGKVLVTQTDAITIFDGLVVDSKPTVNSGASEKGKLWGDLRAEQNSANAYVTAPAVDQRQVNEMVRGMASDMPAGVDLSKAKAWIYFHTGGTISGSFNIKSVTANSTGNATVNFATPFKSVNYVLTFGTAFDGGPSGSIIADNGSASAANKTVDSCLVRTTYSNSNSTAVATKVNMAFFGELENE